MHTHVYVCARACVCEWVQGLQKPMSIFIISLIVCPLKLLNFHYATTAPSLTLLLFYVLSHLFSSLFLHFILSFCLCIWFPQSFLSFPLISNFSFSLNMTRAHSYPPCSSKYLKNFAFIPSNNFTGIQPYPPITLTKLHKSKKITTGKSAQKN